MTGLKIWPVKGKEILRIHICLSFNSESIFTENQPSTNPFLSTIRNLTVPDNSTFGGYSFSGG